MQPIIILLAKFHFLSPQNNSGSSSALLFFYKKMNQQLKFCRLYQLTINMSVSTPQMDLEYQITWFRADSKFLTLRCLLLKSFCVYCLVTMVTE